jgi:hypothetical protein
VGWRQGGLQRSTATEQRGIPLGHRPPGASRHDLPLLEPTPRTSRRTDQRLGERIGQTAPLHRAQGPVVPAGVSRARRTASRHRASLPTCGRRSQTGRRVFALLVQRVVPTFANVTGTEVAAAVRPPLTGVKVIVPVPPQGVTSFADTGTLV